MRNSIARASFVWSVSWHGVQCTGEFRQSRRLAYSCAPGLPFFLQCQADDLVQPEADMENLHLRRHGWMPLRASNFPMLTRASDSGMGELLPAVFGARAIASSRTQCYPTLWRHGVQACSGCQQEGHGAAATEGVWHRAAESSHACLLGQYHLFLPCLPGLLRSIFHDSVNLALLSVAREVH